MKQKENIFEELNKMRNLIYSKSGVVISEQANPSSDAGTVMRELDKTNSDESKIVNIVKNYKDKDSFKNFLDQYKTIASMDFALDVARAIQPYNDPTEWKDLVNHLKTLGITATWITRDTRSGGSYINLAGLTTPAAPATNTDEAWKTTYSCVTTQPGAKAVKTNNAGTAYLVGQIYYYSNGRKKLADGTMANYTCAEFQSGNSRVVSGSRQSGPSVNTRFADSAKSLGVEGGKMDLQTLQTILKSLEGETTAAGTPTQGTPDLAQLTAALNQLQA